jgi:hypothetical protein
MTLESLMGESEGTRGKELVLRNAFMVRYDSNSREMGRTQSHDVS